MGYPRGEVFALHAARLAREENSKTLDRSSNDGVASCEETKESRRWSRRYLPGPARSL